MQSVTDVEKMASHINKLKGSMKEPNIFQNYETEKVTHKASDTAEYIKLFSSFT